jgi:hypothetical protein
MLSSAFIKQEPPAAGQPRIYDSPGLTPPILRERAAGTRGKDWFRNTESRRGASLSTATVSGSASSPGPYRGKTEQGKACQNSTEGRLRNGSRGY